VKLALHTRYDAINTAIFLPSGGSRRVRRALVDDLDVRPGERALEFGCGTGQVTSLLLARGADVTAVDALAAMLDGARRRAPTATFVEGDAFTVSVGDYFDLVVLAFVLHNLDADHRRRLLARAAGALHDGRIGILDWSTPHGWMAAPWRRFLHRLEPSPSVDDILDGSLGDDLRAAGVDVTHHRRIAGGRAQVLVARPHP
jgi:demethylmenaquinone methyltransferase/2-methoxy-6-polyprenyl-1,4-benzoquinol methylase